MLQMGVPVLTIALLRFFFVGLCVEADSFRVLVRVEIVLGHDFGDSLLGPTLH